MGKIYLKNGTVLTGIASLEHNTVIIEDDKIADVISERRFKERKLNHDDEVIDVNGAYISPGFIDTHIHGLHGYDTTDKTHEAMQQISKALIEYGVTSFCPAIYPQAEKDLIKAISNTIEVMGHEEGAEILGMHLEGPFISRDKHGVLNQEYLSEVDLDYMNRLYEAAKGNITIMTVAPEIKNMRELALFGTKHNIIMAAGHSDATYENMVEGMQAGILHSTHFFNAMRRLHHRDPGVVGGIMIHPSISCEIIADGHHVHPAIIKLLLRVKPINKLVLVTDALKPTGLQSGKLFANDEEVYLKDGLFRRKSDGTIAGSGLTMDRGVKYLNKEIHLPIGDAVKMATSNPAEVINKENEIGYIIPGRYADITVFDDDFNIKMVMKRGKVLKNEME